MKDIFEAVKLNTHIISEGKRECCECGDIIVEEKDAGGVGKFRFHSQAPCFHLKLTGKDVTINWLKNQKKPDGVILRFTESGLCLEIVEMKSKLNAKSWEAAKDQAEAGLLNALAIKGIFDLPEFSGITFHIAYKSDNLSVCHSSSPSLFRVPIGEKVEKPKWMDWECGEIELLGAKAARINKITRDENGDCFCNL